MAYPKNPVARDILLLFCCLLLGCCTPAWACCPNYTITCGTTCCSNGTSCADAAIGLCCPANTYFTNGICCPSNTVNIDGVCCGAGESLCNGKCCGGQCCHNQCYSSSLICPIQDPPCAKPCSLPINCGPGESCADGCCIRDIP
jgi:hypothetical protein